jgi:c-di-GMP-binding flagellar brake protein YcgR
MVLTNQQYGEVLNFLRSCSTSPGAEKRRTTRVDVSARIKLVVLAKGSPARQISVCTRDISIEGVGLLSGTALQKGQSLVITLPRSDSAIEFVLGEVTYCGAVADGIYSVGCRFVKALSPSLFEKLQKTEHKVLQGA